MTETNEIILDKIDDYRFEIPVTARLGMRVPGRIFANEKLLHDILKDKAMEQVTNVAFLPGIVNYSLAMPDMHWGYGFPIGGVAATDPKNGGVVSPGGVGFDINCGVRLTRTNFQEKDVRPLLRQLVGKLYEYVPSGLGSKSELRVSQNDLKQVGLKGARWAVKQGFGTESDLECTEDNGAIQGADPATVSERAYQRGREQIGTLGSGNHFLELQVIDDIFEEEIAGQLNLFKGQVVFMIHCGSRGFGYQIGRA